MRGVFDGEEQVLEQPRHETELTLSSTTLLAIFFGLVLVCGLCFGLGYTLGHRGSQSPLQTAQSSSLAPTTLPVDTSMPKPSATTSIGATPQMQSAVEDQQQAATEDADLAANSQSTAPSAVSGQPQVRAALPTVVNAALPAQPASVSSASSAIASAVPLMVQIAAVSNQEDADVLVSALRSRGYGVVAHQETADGLIHVRIGPFISRDVANRWRLKLLNDGYNALVQP